MANTVNVIIKADDQASKTIGDVNEKAGGLGKTLGDVTKIAGGFVLGQAFINAPSLISGFVSAASDMSETLSKSNTVFGEQGKAIEKWASGAARDFGQSKEQALAAAGSFGNMFTQLGIGTDVAADMSMQMVELASDFASFHNADITEVLIAQQAAFRGEYDALQRFVPTINAATVEQKALAMTGKETTKELTQQEKALAVQAIMMENAGAAAGDFDRTVSGLANQQRVLSAEWENAKVNLGEALMPAMVATVGFILNDFIPGVKAFVDVAGPYVTQFVEGVRNEWAKFRPYFEQDIRPVLENVQSAFEALSPIILPILAQIAAMVKITVELITGSLDILIKLLSGDFAGAWEASKELVGNYAEYVQTTIENMRDLVLGALILLKEGSVAVFGDMSQNMTRKFTDLKNDLLNAVADIKYGLIEAFQQTKDWIGRVWDGIVDVIKWPINQAIGLINRLIAAWNGLSFGVGGGSFMGVNIPRLDISTPDVGYIPYLAKGGIVNRPTLAMIGEGGPEAVVPLSGPNARGLGAVINIYITQPLGTPMEIARVVKDALVYNERRGGINPITRPTN